MKQQKDMKGVMKKKGWIVFFLVTLTSPVFGQPSGGPNPDEPQIHVESSNYAFPVGEEVKILRAERKKKMPYLDRRYVKETINKRTVKEKEKFAEKKGKNLDEVIERAVEISTPVKAARERITLAKRRRMAALRELFPSGDLNFEIRNGSLSRDAFTGKDYHLAFRMPVFRGGALWNAYLQERAQYQAAKKEYDAVLNELVDEVGKAYFEYNRAREVYEDKKQLSERAKKQQEVSKQKFDQSLISEIEYLNVDSMSGQLQYETETAEQELELAKLELQRYLDLDSTTPIDVESVYNVDTLIKQADPRAAKPEQAIAEQPDLAHSLDEFIDLAYQNRPELQVQAARLRASRLEELVSRAPFLPRLDVTMEFGELGEAFTRFADHPSTNPEWRFAFELSQNFFGNKAKFGFDNDENAPSVAQFQQGAGSQVTKRHMELGFLNGLQDYVSLKEAQVKKLEQVIELEKKEREMIREVKEAYFDYRKAKIQVASSLKRNQYRYRLVELAKIRLSKAEIEISEYLQAELDLSEERKKLHGALADLYKAKSKLNRSIGIRNFLPVGEQYGH